MNQESMEKKIATVPTPNINEIVHFLKQYGNITSDRQAKEVLNYLLPLKEEWKEYYKILDSFVFPQIYERIASAYRVLEQYEDGIKAIQECLNVIENAVEYKWLYGVKSELFQYLAILYFDIDDIESTKNALSDSIFYFLSNYNHKHYDKFDFYSFRPMSDYLLDSIKNDYITVTDPQEFNDPVDPAMLQHLDYLANHGKNKKDKQLYLIEKEIFGKVRIRSLVRTLHLPLKEGRDVKTVKEIERERNLTTMWAYYADNHKGICIKYVFPSSLTTNETNKDAVLMLGEVEYKAEYNSQKVDIDLKEALFSKGLHWQYENERRLVYFHRYRDEKFMKINLPSDCITEIYIGVRTTYEDKLKIKEAVKNKPNIKLFQMKISDSNIFQLESEPIDIKTWLNEPKSLKQELEKLRILEDETIVKAIQQIDEITTKIEMTNNELVKFLKK